MGMIKTGAHWLPGSTLKFTAIVAINIPTFRADKTHMKRDKLFRQNYPVLK